MATFQKPAFLERLNYAAAHIRAVIFYVPVTLVTGFFSQLQWWSGF